MSLLKSEAWKVEAWRLKPEGWSLAWSQKPEAWCQKPETWSQNLKLEAGSLKPEAWRSRLDRSTIYLTPVLRRFALNTLTQVPGSEFRVGVTLMSDVSTSSIQTPAFGGIKLILGFCGFWLFTRNINHYFNILQFTSSFIFWTNLSIFLRNISTSRK